MLARITLEKRVKETKQLCRGEDSGGDISCVVSKPVKEGMTGDRAGAPGQADLPAPSGPAAVAPLGPALPVCVTAAASMLFRLPALGLLRSANKLRGKCLSP